MKAIGNEIERILAEENGKTIETAGLNELYSAVSKAALHRVMPVWKKSRAADFSGKRVGYFSAEFMIGRMIYSNLMNMGELDNVAELLSQHGADISVFEDVEDAALGNGGLGRLAACFLDSAASVGIPLDGYGIRYRYGLFRQSFADGFQVETADDWQRFGDPWSMRCEDESVTVSFGGQEVRAVPYDMPVIGYGAKTVNTLRLWQSEAVRPFDFTLFNAQKYDAAVKERNDADAICDLLYPNDDTIKGKRLRLKQQYFFASASLQDMIAKYKSHGGDFSRFAEFHAIQLNDTHPVVAIPEFLRLMIEKENMAPDDAIALARDLFAYTNHTIMPEALEKWSVRLFKSVLPQVYPYVQLLDSALRAELRKKKVPADEYVKYRIICGGVVHMARMAIFATHSTNGVAQLHTEILKNSALPEWYALWPERFNNKTNGITQRRWLALANPELSRLITDSIGGGWITGLEKLKALEPMAGDAVFRSRFMDVKRQKKEQLARFIEQREGVKINPDAIFDVQVKRLHEYKRQLLNAFGILDTYFGIKDGRITDFYPTVYIFGAKAAPGYYRAKGIIKYINEIGKMIASDPDVCGKLQVVFVQNYNVSYAEKIIPAADVSEQISTAGTEASGTGNMKLMLNGAVTLGTFDGANVEIVEQAGRENNYIFGATVEQLEQIGGGYDPMSIIGKNDRIRRAVETLIDGTFDDGGTGILRELYDSLTVGAVWHEPDHYRLMLDMMPYCDAREQINRDYRDRDGFAKKCIINVANAGKFSSDRTVKQYAKDIWHI